MEGLVPFSLSLSRERKFEFVRIAEVSLCLNEYFFTGHVLS